MATFKILGTFTRNAATGVVPPGFRDAVRRVTTDGPFVVILFAHNREKGGVTHSSVVRRALAKIPATARVLAVGHDFTTEATTLLADRDAVVARIGEFGWTDQSYLDLSKRAT